MREIDFNPTVEYPTTSLAKCISEGYREVTRDEFHWQLWTQDAYATAAEN